MMDVVRMSQGSHEAIFQISLNVPLCQSGTYEINLLLNNLNETNQCITSNNKNTYLFYDICLFFIQNYI